MSRLKQSLKTAKYIYLIFNFILTCNMLSAQVKATVSGHSVSLTCTDSASNVTFNFYRGSTPGNESSTPLNSTPLSTCSYTDTAVVGLGTYFYTAKAYCTTCSPTLSNASNEVEATIPADGQPAAPVLSLGTISKNNVPLSWTIAQQDEVVVNSTSIFRCTKSVCTNPPKIATVTGNNYTDKPSKGIHYYEVKANDTVNGVNVVSPASNIVMANVTSIKFIDRLKSIFK